MGWNTKCYVIPEDPDYVPDAEAVGRAVEALVSTGAFVPWALTHLVGRRGEDVVVHRMVEPQRASSLVRSERLEDFLIFQYLRRGKSSLLDALDWEFDPDRDEPEPFGIGVYPGYVTFDSECGGFGRVSFDSDGVNHERDTACPKCGEPILNGDSAYLRVYHDSVHSGSCASCGSPIPWTELPAWIQEPAGNEDPHSLTTFRPVARTVLFLDFDKGWPIVINGNHHWYGSHPFADAVSKAWDLPLHPIVVVG